MAICKFNFIFCTKNKYNYFLLTQRNQYWDLQWEGRQLSTTGNTRNVLSSIPHCLQLQFLLASELFFLPDKGIGLHSTSAVNSKLCCHSPSVNYEQCTISKKLYLFFKAGQHFPLKNPLTIISLEITQPLQKCILFTTQELHGEENYRPCWVTKSTTRAQSVAEDSIIILIAYLWHSDKTKHQCEHLVISH